MSCETITLYQTFVENTLWHCNLLSIHNRYPLVKNRWWLQKSKIFVLLTMEWTWSEKNICSHLYCVQCTSNHFDYIVLSHLKKVSCYQECHRVKKKQFPYFYVHRRMECICIDPKTFSFYTHKGTNPVNKFEENSPAWIRQEIYIFVEIQINF
jgi:hypothetical protein